MAGPTAYELLAVLRRDYYGLPPSGLAGNPGGTVPGLPYGQQRAISQGLLAYSRANPELSAEDAVAQYSLALGDLGLPSADAAAQLEKTEDLDAALAVIAGIIATDDTAAPTNDFDDFGEPAYIPPADFADQLIANGYTETAPGSGIYGKVDEYGETQIVNLNESAPPSQRPFVIDGQLVDAEGNVLFGEPSATGPGFVSANTAAQQAAANQRAALNAGVSGFGSLVDSLAPLAQAGTAANRLQADILARPADFATRALQIRGGTPDFAETTQADLINRLGGFMRAINEQLAGFQQRPVTGFGISGPPVVPPPATASRTTVPSDGTSEWDAEGQRDIMEQRAAGAYDGIPSWARADWMIPRTPAEIAAAEAAAFDQEQRDREEASRPPFVATSPVVTPDIFNTAETPGISTEDFFRQHAAMFPVDTPESVYGRQGAGVTSEETTLEHGGFANRAIVGDSSDGKENPELVEALPGGGFRVTPVDKKRISKRVSRAQDGGTFGDLGLLGTLPGVPEIDTVTQDQIQESALGVAQGTGFGDIFAGQRPTPLQFGHVGGGFKLPTAIGLGSLTPDERTAFGSLLATRNTSLGDVETAVRQRFARPNTRPLATLRSRGF